MKFSIVTSFYNESEDLINAVCQSVLSQTYTNFEWVVTDDFSKDSNTTRVVKSLPERDKRIRYVEEKSKKEVWWNPQTYAIGDIVVTVDGDDHMFPKALEVLNYFYIKYPDVICITTEIKNYNQNGGYIGSCYINRDNYKNHLDYCLHKKHNPDIPDHGKNDLFTHGYNRSWRNIGGLDFKEDLDNRLITVDFLELTKLEEIGKILHIPRALYGYNTRDVSISRKIDDHNNHQIRTQEIDQSIVERRNGREIDGIKRIFDGLYVESNAFLDCDISIDSTAKKLLFITPEILSPYKENQIEELYFDHKIYFNEYVEDVDYVIAQFNSTDQFDSFMPIYQKLLKYIGKKNVMIQITYKEANAENRNLFLRFKSILEGRHYMSWFDFNNQYISLKIY